MMRLQPAQQGAGITLNGVVTHNGPLPTQQQPWQKASLTKPPAEVFADEDVVAFCSRWQRRPQRAAEPAPPFLTAQQPVVCRALNGASNVATAAQQNQSARKAPESRKRQRRK
jgi:hypothetical protein